MINFSTSLKEKGLKSTIQRLSILEEIDASGHASIEDIYQKVKEKFSNISLNTIHINLHTLIEANLITKIALENKKAVYEIKQPEHIHLVCSVCNEIIDYRNGEVSEDFL